VLLVLLCLGGAGVVSASPAAALPGLCNPDAPVPDAPGSGMPGFFMEAGSVRPPAAGSDVKADPHHLYNDGGFSGLSSNTYDLGCSQNPANWGKTIGAMSDTSLGNRGVSVGQSATALADAVDRVAWSPSWLGQILGDFTTKVMSVATSRIVLLLLGAGLLLTTVILVIQSRKGNVAAVAGGVAWALFVVVIMSILVVAPLKVATTTQSVGSGAISNLQGENADRGPGRASTEQAMYSVHYQGWLRRTFGSANSQTALQYGPELLAASRITREEYARTDPGRTVDGHALSADQKEKALKDRKALLDAKAKKYESIAAKIKDADPSAYRYLQGVGGTSTGVGAVEMSFALVSAFFRLATAGLLILCTVVLVMLGIAWVIGGPLLVTPFGESVGRGLLNNSGRAILFVILAALGSWMFGLWTEVALMPGLPAWWSMVLLLVGTIILWSLIRPDRKALNLITMGHMHGHSSTMKKMVAMAGGSFVGGKAAAVWTATKDRAKSERDQARSEMKGSPADTERARMYRLGHHTADPYKMKPPAERDVYAATNSPKEVVKPSVPVYTPPKYQQPDQPAWGTAPSPPPAGATGTEEIYTITDVKARDLPKGTS